jgi:hypothetical protein
MLVTHRRQALSNFGGRPNGEQSTTDQTHDGDGF